jgi:hypothetical protein
MKKNHQGLNWQVKFNRLGGPLVDRETKDDVDVEAPRNRRERRAVAAWKRRQEKRNGRG